MAAAATPTASAPATLAHCRRRALDGLDEAGIVALARE